MSMLICNVRDLEAANRRSLESLLGQPLAEDEQVLIRVIGLGKEPDAAAKAAALHRAREISDKASRQREAIGVPAVEADQLIDEAIEDIRRTPS